MSPEKTKELNEQFPFLRTSGNMQVDLMMFGFECGDGWFDLLKDLFTKIAEYLEEHPDPEFQVVQVKEKYGGLRVYVTAADKPIFDFIEEAEKQSEMLCEVCGKPGEIRPGGWLSCLCEEHMKQ